jgi:hypothetical protein
VDIENAMTISTGEWLFNLGVDSKTPDYDGTTHTLWDSPVSDGDNAVANPDGYFTTGRGGNMRGWLESGATVVSLLFTDQTPTPLVVIPHWDLGREVAN